MTDQGSPAISLRAAVAGVAVDREVVMVRGSDAESFLQSQVTQNVESLAVGSSAWSFILQPHGKVDAFVRLSRIAADGFAVDVDQGYGDSVVERLKRFKLRTKAEIEKHPNLQMLAVRGVGQHQVDTAAEGLPAPLFASASMWPGIAGLDLFYESAIPDVQLPMAGPGDYEALRIESGMPKMGTELDEKTIPGEAGVNHLAVDFRKGCYTGQELVARIESRGNKFPRRLAGVVLQGSEVPLRGALIRNPEGTAEKPWGVVTSAAWSEGVRRPVALAYVRRDVVVPSQASVEMVDTLVEAQLSLLPMTNLSITELPTKGAER